MENGLTLEQAEQRLELLIGRLENEALPIEESVKIYTEACELLARCVSEIKSYREKTEKAFEVLEPLVSEEAEADEFGLP